MRGRRDLLLSAPDSAYIGKGKSPFCTRVRMNVEEQVEYWRNGSREDLAAAETLIEKGHLRHGLFFTHLALEKMLKAHVTRQTKSVPPRIHGLARLVSLAGLKLEAGQMDFLREFSTHQMGGRYPDAEQFEIDADFARDELRRAKEILTWLSGQL
jgi:HEPN domain-containing protein